MSGDRRARLCGVNCSWRVCTSTQRAERGESTAVFAVVAPSQALCGRRSGRGHLPGEAVFGFTLGGGSGAMPRSLKGGRDHAHLGTSPWVSNWLSWGGLAVVTGLVTWVVYPVSSGG